MSADRAVGFTIEAGHVMAFARAVGEDDPRYERLLTVDGPGEATDVPVPPTFLAAAAHYDPEWPLRPHPGRVWAGSGRGPGTPLPGDDDGGTALHAEQHYEFHRPLRAGMRLTGTTHAGDEWTRTGRRGGTLHFSEFVTEWRDEDGVLVATARSVGVRTERVVQETP